MNLLTLSFVLMALGKPGGVFGPYTNNKIENGPQQSIDTNISNKKLPIYHAISCIDDLLKDIVKANQKFYDPKKYFYSLSFTRQRGKRFIVVDMGRYKASRIFDYIGAIKIGRSVFLCWGDIATDTLFKVTNAFLEVHLEAVKKSDSVDFGSEPSLSGSYQECAGINISLEIYTRGKLPGYKMEMRKK